MAAAYPQATVRLLNHATHPLVPFSHLLSVGCCSWSRHSAWGSYRWVRRGTVSTSVRVSPSKCGVKLRETSVVRKLTR